MSVEGSTLNVERSAPRGAVFLSYASQDADAAKRICEALRAANIEVWFDQSELRGGDAWDQKIRRQIKECALFMPVISANTNARPEGYFRLEWKLAVDRSHLMADDAPFLFPIVIGDVSDAAARVPDKFRDVQWTRLRLDETPAELAKRVGRLLSTEDERKSTEYGGQKTEGRTGGRREKRGFEKWWWLIFPIFGMIMAIFPMLKEAGLLGDHSKPREREKSVATAAAPAVSEARQLALKARTLFEDVDSTVDDYKTAEGLLQRAVTLDPTDGFILAVYSRLNSGYAMRGYDFSPSRFEDARSQMERAIRLAPGEAEVWLARGAYLRRTAGDRGEAEKALRKAIELAPQDTRPWFDLAWAAGQPGKNSAEILEYLDKSIDPARPGSDALAHYNQFLLLFGDRRFAEADARVRQSVAEMPSANFVTGLVRSELTWQGDAAAAVTALEKLTAEKRKETRSVWFAAYAHLLARQPDATLADLRLLPGDFIEDSFFSGPKAYWEGRAQQQLGNADAARVAWETALAVSRREGPGRQQRGLLMQAELLARLDRPEEALQAVHAYEQATTGGRKRGAQAWISSSARVYVLLGRLDEALPLIEADLKASGVAWPLTPALLKIDPVWDKIRDDPRFQKLIAVPDQRAEDGGQGATVAPDSKSVAVLAFADLSEKHDSEYFSDGISEELLNVLAKVPGLKVSARTSAFHFKGTNTAIPEIARQLGVAYVVEGSVRKAGEKVRITAQLIKADGGFHVWSDTFTRDLKDIFAVQDEIAGLIAKNLELKIVSPATAAATIDPEAYRLYLEGRQILQRRTQESFAQAEKLFEQAKAIVPAWAPVYVGLAEVARLRAFGPETGPRGPNSPWPPDMKQAKALADHALELDPSLAGAYVSLGGTYMLAWNFPEAERLVRRAIELNPNEADAYLVLGRILSAEGRMDESIAALRRSVDLNPLAPRILDNLAAELEFAGRYPEAWEIIERASALQPDSSQIQCYRVRLLADLGRRDDAVAMARQMMANTNPEEREFRLIEVARTYVTFGMKAEAEAALAQVPADLSEHVIGLSYLGRPDQAIPGLDRLTFGWIEDLLWGRGFDPIRRDPGYLAYLARTGLVESDTRARAWRAAHPWPKSNLP